MLKPNISPKSPRNELSNDTFAERKCCQVFAYESETFHRRRPNGISHCEMGNKSPKPSLSARPKCAPKSTPYRGPIAKHHYLSHPWTRPTYDAKRHPDPIRGFSQCTGQRDRPTDRSFTGKFDNYSPLRLKRDRRGLKTRNIN